MVDRGGNMAVEREIRFRVIAGEAPADARARGESMTQAYLLRGPVTLRVRCCEGRPARLTLKAPRHEGRFEWECDLPGWLARALLSLPLPRVEKRRERVGRLEIDRLAWPEPWILCELELGEGEGPDLRDVAARGAWMELHRPSWVSAWEDVTDDPRFTNAQLARRRPFSRRGR